MSVVVRRVAATPVRGATATWERVCDLLAQAGTEEHQRLHSVRNVAAIIIAEQYSADAPIIILPPRGNRIRIYTLHDDAALGEQVSEAALASWPLAAAGWQVSLPCASGDLNVLGPALGARPGFALRDAAQALDPRPADVPRTAGAPDQNALRVDFEQVRRS